MALAERCAGFCVGFLSDEEAPVSGNRILVWLGFAVFVCVIAVVWLSASVGRPSPDSIAQAGFSRAAH
jgi:hypothetical protein